MAGLERRLERLEERLHPVHLSYEGWPLTDQMEDVFCYLRLHARWDSVAACTDQQLYCLGLIVAGWENPDAELEDLSPVELEHFPNEVREHVSRMDPRSQPERDAWLREEAGYFVRELEELPVRLAAVEAQQRARAEESRRRDRELIARNRALVGLPPLESDHHRSGAPQESTGLRGDLRQPPWRYRRARNRAPQGIHLDGLQV